MLRFRIRMGAEMVVSETVISWRNRREINCFSQTFQSISGLLPKPSTTMELCQILMSLSGTVTALMMNKKRGSYPNRHYPRKFLKKLSLVKETSFLLVLFRRRRKIQMMRKILPKTKKVIMKRKRFRIL